MSTERPFIRPIVLIAFATSDVLTQAPSQAPAAAGPTFEVVSIKRNTTNALGSNGSSQRPDGGFTMVNVIVGTLISRAYPGSAPIDMVGLPGWATNERYDVSATSSLSSPTPDERTAMLRAMLADRFKLAVHFENREQPAYDLVVARRDGRLGPAIRPSDACLTNRLITTMGPPPCRRDSRRPARR